MQNGETFRPARKPETDPKNQGGPPGQSPMGGNLPPNMPPIVAKALHKNMEKIASEGFQNENVAPEVTHYGNPQQPNFAPPTQQNYPQQYGPSFPEGQVQYSVKDGGRAEMVGGPRLAYGTNEQLNDLIAGMKELDVYAYREVQLPSFGKFYDGSDCTTNGIVHVRPMAGTEEEVLSSPAMFRNGQAI